MKQRPPSVVGPFRSNCTSSASAILAAAVALSLASRAPAQQRFDELVRVLNGSGYSRSTVVAGDIDGDGDQDLLFSDPYRRTRLYLNDGTANFAEATASHLPSGNIGTQAMALGDIDGDGDLDLLLGAEQTSLWVNNGVGLFTDVTAPQLPAITGAMDSVAMRDVDGDGDLDILMGRITSWNARTFLLRNNGLGSFVYAPSTMLPIGSGGVRAFGFGDFNSDGRTDLLVSLHSQGPSSPSTTYLHSGVAAGGFAAGIAIGTGFTRSICVGDVDRDGDLDVVLVNEGSNTSRLYLNNGGTFNVASPGRIPSGIESARAGTLCDIDRDGDLDLVLASGFLGLQNQVLRNNGAGFYTDATAALMPADQEYASGMVMADLDGDGDQDLALANDDAAAGQHRIYLNNGSGKFQNATPFRLPADFDHSLGIALGDIDGDGDLDLAVGKMDMVYSGQTQLLRNDQGQFVDVTASNMPTMPEGAVALQFADVDSDGWVDLVSSGAVYHNNGAGSFTRQPLPAWIRSFALGDLDRDGDLDIVGGNYRTYVFLNDGTGHFTDASWGLPPAFTALGAYQHQCVALGDVDGDGDLDLAIGQEGSTYGSQSNLLLNNGTGRFTDATSLLPTATLKVTSLAFGDIDGDGDSDLILGAFPISVYVYGMRPQVYQNDGTGRFLDVTLTHGGLYGFPQALALTDVDNDGDLDLLFVTRQGYFPSQTGQPQLGINDGTGRFGGPPSLPVLDDSANSAAVGDLDGDGDVDFVTSNWTRPDRVFFNLLRHLHAPRVLRVGHGFDLEFHTPPGVPALALPFFSTAPESLRLPGIGLLGIDPTQMVALPPYLVPSPVGTLTIPIPFVPSLEGFRVYIQALLQEPGAYHLTNTITETMLR